MTGEGRELAGEGGHAGGWRDGRCRGQEEMETDDPLWLVLAVLVCRDAPQTWWSSPRFMPAYAGAGVEPCRSGEETDTDEPEVSSSERYDSEGWLPARVGKEKEEEPQDTQGNG